MQGDRKMRTAVFTGAAALGLALGSVGIGLAINPTSPPPGAPSNQVSRVTGQDATDTAAELPGSNEATEAGEAPDANEASERGDEATEVEDPSYESSISAPADEGSNEADEGKSLESLATVTPEQAREAALTAVSGTVGEVELENENGAVIYSVEITDASGSRFEVKIDAGNATVLHQGADDDNEG
ncbi:MAG: PepSY domain-containing protein [Acidimicrobiia bacterium]|nr:MAG: PepSY domain-containing protein [Acidimicrobiia bacterium]